MDDDSFGETRWLDADEMTAWLRLVRVMAQLGDQVEDQLRRDAGLSHFEYGVMARLFGAPAHTHRMSTLAQLANGSLSRLSHAVTRLEKQGWVRRETDSRDGRFTNAILTPAGFDKVAESAPGHIAVVRSLVIDALSTGELQNLSGACKVILDVIDCDSADFDHQPHTAGSTSAKSRYGADGAAEAS